MNPEWKSVPDVVLAEFIAHERNVSGVTLDAP